MDRRTFIQTSAAASTILASPRLLLARDPGESDGTFNARLAWWREARFGLFIHWGIYAVLGLGEWAMNNLKIPERAYQPLAKRFNPTQYNPRDWVKAAKAAGMKYVVITSKHHDGFCMFDTKHTDYNVVKATPYKKDVLKMLAEACAEEGIRFGFYYSILDSHQSGLADFRKMKNEGFDKYTEYMFGQLQELLTGYGPIGSIFFDGQWIPQWDGEKGKALEAHCRSFQPEVVINDRVGKQYESGDYNTPEQFIPDKLPDRDWETCMTMALSWGYHFADRGWKSETILIRNLIDIVSKGGNFLLNVGPEPTGKIPKAELIRLAAIGEWMDVNGDSIHGASAGPVQNAPWGRSTQKGNKVYLHVFNWPGEKLVVEGLEDKVGRASLLADPSVSLSCNQTDGRVTIDLPPQAPSPHSSTIVIDR